MAKSIDIRISKPGETKSLKFCTVGGPGLIVFQIHDDGRERAVRNVPGQYPTLILDSKYGFSDEELSQITRWMAEENYSNVVKLFESKGWVKNSEPILRFELPDVDSWNELNIE